ncbi:MAG: hypothetical protein L3I91_01285 [Mycoplasma sp.]
MNYSKNHLNKPLKAVREQTSIYDYQFDDLYQGNFSGEQIIYTHGRGATANLNYEYAKQIDFAYSRKVLLTTNNQNNLNNNPEWFIDPEVITSFKQTTPNTGSPAGMYYQTYYNDDISLVPNWAPDARNYLMLKNSVNDTFKHNLAWSGERIGLSDLSLDQSTIWHLNTSISTMDSFIYYEKDGNQSYKYDNRFTHDFTFHQGRTITDLVNVLHDIDAIAVTYARDAKEVEVVWNWVYRYVWTLKNLENYIYQPDDFDHNSSTYNFDINDFVVVSDVNYWDHTITFKLNPEIKPIMELILNDYLNRKDNFSYWLDEHDLIDLRGLNLAHPYRFAKNYHIIKVYNALNKLLKINIHYSLFDPRKQRYEPYQIHGDIHDLASNGLTIKLKPNINGDYRIKLNQIEVLKNSDEHVYLAHNFVNFNNDKGSKYLLYDEGDQSYYIQLLDVKAIQFNALSDELINKFPSYIKVNELIGRYVRFYDQLDHEIPFNHIDPKWIKLIPDDTKGELNIVSNLNDVHFQKIVTHLKKFDINQFKELDIGSYSYGLFASDFDVFQVQKYLKAINFDLNYWNEQKMQLIPNDEKGILDINNEITIKGFSQCYLKPINNYQIFKNYNPSEINLKMVKEHLIKYSPGFKSRYSDDEVKYVLNPNDQNKTLEVKITYNQTTKVFKYQFSNEKKIINYLCISFIVLGVLLACILTAYWLINHRKTINKTKALETN